MDDVTLLHSILNVVRQTGHYCTIFGHLVLHVVHCEDALSPAEQ
jgi:hypothetical protein